jgi:hypothetical protein
MTYISRRSWRIIVATVALILLLDRISDAHKCQDAKPYRLLLTENEPRDARSAES